MIDINYLKQLLEIFDESSANDLRIEQDGASIKLSKSPRRDEFSPAAAGLPAPPPPPAPPGPQTHPEEERSAASDQPAAAETHYHEIRSPIVGTYYRSPTPDAAAYVEVGQEVSPGTVLCIVEAMKLMNEIECDTYGRIVKILVDNAQPVEYNQLLFLIEPD